MSELHLIKRKPWRSIPFSVWDEPDLLDALPKIHQVSWEERQETLHRFSYAVSKENFFIEKRVRGVTKPGETPSYYRESSKRDVLQFFQASYTVRKNFPEWKQNLLNPTDKAQFEPGSVLENSGIVFALALLDKCNVINLDPVKPFVIYEQTDEDFQLIDAKVTVDKFMEMVPLWNRLGRPELFDSDLMEKLSDLDFKNLESIGKDKKLTSGNSDCWDIIPEKVLNEHIDELLRWGLSIPISHHEGSIFKFDPHKLLISTSLAMALEPEGLDILECIRELFPHDSELIPDIINDYHYKVQTIQKDAEYISFRISMQKVALELKEAMQLRDEEVYGRDSENAPAHGGSCDLYHRGALKQIENYPELFDKWKKCDRMKPIYHALVAPAIRKKLGIVWNL